MSARSAGSIAASLLVVSCATPSLAEGDLARVEELWPAGPAVVRLELQVTMAAPATAGSFTGLLVARRDPLAARVQLFPEIGGKVLDLVATPDAQRGFFTGAEEVLDRPDDPGGSRLLHCFAVSLLEVFGDFDAGRALGGHAADDGFALVLRPRFGEDACRVTIGDGRRVFDLGCRGWSFRLQEEGGRVRVTARGFRLVAEVRHREELIDAPDGAFALELPRDG